MRTIERGSAQPLVTDPRVVAACGRILENLDDITARVAARIRASEPIYVTTVTREQLEASLRPNIVGMVENLMLDEPASLAAPRRTGRARAAHGIPLPPVLHAYRIGALVIWDDLVEICSSDAESSRALLASAQKLWTGLDVFSQELAAAYRDVETEHLLRDARVREAALAAIFSGVAPPGRTLTEMADVLRLPAAGHFVVIVCEPSEPSEASETVEAGAERRGEGAEAPRAGATSVEKTLTALGVRSAWRSEAELEIGLAMLTRTYRLDRLTDHLASLGLGRIGVSRVYAALADTPLALAQARLAREAAPARTARLTHFEDARIPGLLLGSAMLAEDLRRDVLAGLADLPPAEVDRLLETFRGWVEADGSADAAGAVLHCHPNTVRYRLAKLGALLGRDLRRPVDVVHVLLAAEAHRLAGEPLPATQP